MPKCYIISGPNGAGKTTFAIRFLGETIGCENFINADMIASGISPLNPSKAQVTASKVFLNELKSNMAKKVDFAFETTLSGRTYLKTVQKLKSSGWTVILYYLWIPSIEFSVERVRSRVIQGGHDIPLDAIHRRYSRSIKKLINEYMHICNNVYCYDNSSIVPCEVFEKDENGIIIYNQDIFNQILEISNG